jgi:hypothetical protein
MVNQTDRNETLSRCQSDRNTQCLFTKNEIDLNYLDWTTWCGVILPTCIDRPKWNQHTLSIIWVIRPWEANSTWQTLGATATNLDLYTSRICK